MEVEIHESWATICAVSDLCRPNEYQFRCSNSISCYCFLLCCVLDGFILAIYRFSVKNLHKHAKSIDLVNCSVRGYEADIKIEQIHEKIPNNRNLHVIVLRMHNLSYPEEQSGGDLACLDNAGGERRD